jgi:hypothetical protein
MVSMGLLAVGVVLAMLVARRFASVSTSPL